MSVVPVLTYHHVAPDRDITPETLEKHLLWLKGQGYRTLRVSDLERHADGTKPASEKSLVLTFDDAYADAWVYAHPLLKKHGMTAVLFIPTAFPTMSSLKRLTSEDGGSISDTRTLERGLDGFLSWGEIKAMASSGVWELGSHTLSHRSFHPETPYGRMDDELVVSRQVIESRTGHPCPAFAWPWGQVVPEWAVCLGKCGYRVAFASEAGLNETGTDPLRLGRFMVRQTAVSWLKRMLLPGASGPAGKSRPTVRTAKR
ncbi:MAG: polysaccharide deacetylase family protein [Elusimicrobia bacterium]|nr:polysaccharide deacetylase family protein [Elusimicrobiota bacterium]